jgi:UDP-N-acetylmuramoylalanine--D-glutamate ligase
MKIAIAGYGIEGKASYEYWNTGEHEITIADERTEIELPNGVKSIVGEGAFSKLEGFDVVIRTASLPPNNITTDGKIWSATNEFFAKCPAPIIGVTGTKGKGTTCSLIASILRAAGKNVHLVGNIGTPGLEILPQIQSEDIVVYELSSFQLWDIERSPHVGVCLLIEPDHMNVHADMTEYVTAKSNIARFQQPSDAFFFHPTNEYAAAIALQTSAQVNARYDCAEDRPSVYFDAHDFRFQNEAICSLDALQLRGEHNRENACAALSVAKYLGATNEAIEKGLRDFTGLPHRLKFVAEKNGVAYYDDSISTTQGSAIAALSSFTQPKVIILGGSSKGTSYDKVIAKCAATNSKIIAIGETAGQIVEAAARLGAECVQQTGGMKDVVTQAAAMAPAGSVVILSPASASFDMFKNYADRGDQFIATVEAL